MTAAPVVPSLISLRIQLPESLFDAYAQAGSGEVEQAIVKRLAACVTYNDQKPLYFSDAQRMQLEQLLGQNFSSAETVIVAIRRRATVRVNKVEIELKPVLLERLKSRCFGKSFTTFLKERIVEALEQYCGMR